MINKANIKNELYIKAQKFFENEEQKVLESFKKDNISESNLKRLMEVEYLREKVMFRESDKPMILEDGDISHSNGYSNGLYDGAVSQNDKTINKVLDILFSELNKDIDVYWSSKGLRFLNVYNEIKWVFSHGKSYDINIAVSDNNIFDKYVLKYFIIAFKNFDDNEFNYALVSTNEVDCLYEPTKEELEKINEEYKKLLMIKPQMVD